MNLSKVDSYNYSFTQNSWTLFLFLESYYSEVERIRKAQVCASAGTVPVTEPRINNYWMNMASVAKKSDKLWPLS